jgi:hypothetical protein
MAKKVEAKAKTKSLTVASVKNEVKVLNEQIELEVFSKASGESYTLTVDKHLRNSKIVDLVSEFMVQLQYAREHKIRIEDIIVQYSVFLLIKHFTSFGVGVASDLESQIKVMEHLIDLDLMSPIVDAFDEDEVTAIFESISKTVEQTEKDIQDMTDRILKGQLGFEVRDDVTFTKEDDGLPETTGGLIHTPMDIVEISFDGEQGDQKTETWS